MTVLLRHPVGVIQIPMHGFADAGLEGLGGGPAQLGFQLAGINGVAAVVAGAVGYVGDLVLAGLAMMAGS